MNTTSLLELQTQALLDRLAREQAEHTRRVHEEAATQGRDIVRRARAEARARVHEAVRQTRREHELAVQRRRAALDTQRRQRRQAALRRWLDDAWRRLPLALEARWQDGTSREEWCRAACRQALRSLVHTEQLVVRVDARWRDELRPVLERSLPATTDGTLEIEPVAGLGPGLTIAGGLARVDATLAGLLAARERVAAALLAGIDAGLEPGRSVSA